MKSEAIARRAFLSTVGLGAAAVVGSAGTTDAAQWTGAEQSNVKLVTDFCRTVSTRDVARVVRFFADDCVSRMTETTPPVSGREALGSTVTSFIDRYGQVEFEVLNTFAVGPIVINHRIDRFTSARQEDLKPFTWEGVGVFFVKDGKIKEWSDYTIHLQR